MLAGMKAKPKTTYVTACPATWELIRAAYLSGLSAPTAAARFGVSVGALRKRAAREGWTKRAHAAAGPYAAREPAAPEPAPATAPATVDPHREGMPAHLAALHEKVSPPISYEPGSVARMALRQSVRCLLAGDPVASAHYARAADAIRKLDVTLEWGDRDDDPAEVEARQSAYREFTFQVAGELAGLLVRGEPVPPGYLAKAEAWRARYAAKADAEAEAER